MRDQKEILIQDLSKENEINLYIDYLVYRRDVTFGSPLYFSPYFTKESGKTVGVTHLSKILGVLTAKPKDIGNFKDELLGYADNNVDLVNKWTNGINSIESSTPATFYFLAPSVELNKPLIKDGGIQKGRGKGWIAAQIPKNRCVTFEEFIRRMIMEQAN